MADCTGLDGQLRLQWQDVQLTQRPMPLKQAISGAATQAATKLEVHSARRMHSTKLPVKQAFSEQASMLKEQASTSGDMSCPEWSGGRNTGDQDGISV